MSLLTNLQKCSGITCAGVLARTLLAAIMLILAACNASDLGDNLEAGRVLENDDLPGTGDLVTDDEFAPKVSDFYPFELCSYNAAGVISKSKCSREIKEKTVFGRGGVRYLITFSKPVRFDETSVGDQEFENADFINRTVENNRFWPVERGTNEFGEQDLVEVEKLDETKSYTYFTTPKEHGYIEANSDGLYTITIPAGKFYAINPSGEKIYNTSIEKVYTYDSSPPRATITFDIDIMNPPNKLMSPNASEDDGADSNFASIIMTVDWEETVEPVSSIAALLQGGDLLNVFCKDCTEQPYNRGKSPNAKGDGVTYLGTNPPTNSIYRFQLNETEITDKMMDRLQTAAYIDFTVLKESFKDLAGNENEADANSRVTVDRTRPQVQTISTIPVGAVIPGGSENGDQEVLGIGDYIEFRVKYTEEVNILNVDNYILNFNIGSGQRVAILTDDEKDVADQYKSLWTFRYYIIEGDGDNRINSTVRSDNSIDIPGSQFLGGNTIGGVSYNWESDIDIAVGFPENLASDRVGLIHQEFSEKSLSDSTIFPTNDRLRQAHVDAIRPRIVTEKVEEYTQIMSATVGEVSQLVGGGEIIAVAIPFSEPIRSPDYPNGIKLDQNSFGSINLALCTNIPSGVDDCATARQSVALVFNKALTEQARTVAGLGEHQHRTAIYTIDNGSGKINATYADIKSVVATSYAIPGAAISTYTDLAQNPFNAKDITQTSFRLNEVIVMNLEGGAYGVNAFNLVKKTGTTYSNVTVSNNERVNYNTVDSKIYVDAQLTRRVNASSTPTSADATLVLQIEKPDGTIVDVSSESVGFTNGQRNRLLFTFNVNNASAGLEDYNGVTVKELIVHSAARLADDEGVNLDTTVTDDKLNEIFENVNVDTIPPVCGTVTLTTNSNGSAADSGTLYFGTRQGNGYSQNLFLGVKCNQRLQYKSHASDLTAFIPVKIGGKNYRMVYSGIFDGALKAVFKLPVQPGMNEGNGLLQIGVQGNKGVNWYIDGSTRDGDITADHQYLTDTAGNRITTSSLTLTNDYLIQQSLYSPDAASPGAGVVINTRPYPIAITYPLATDTAFSGNYKDSGTTYLSGTAGTNTFGFSVDYGYFYNGSVEDASLQQPASYSLEGNIIDADGNTLATFSPQSVSGKTVTYQATIPYGTTNNISIDNLATSFHTYLANQVPYSRYTLTTYHPLNGTTTDITADIPIGKTIVDTNFSTTVTNGGAQLANIKINNIQPKLTTATPKVELYYDRAGDGVDKLNYTGANLPRSYGDIYIAYVFDKDMEETGVANFYPDISVISDSDAEVDITADDLAFVTRQSLESGAFNNDQSKAYITSRKLFFKFSYNKSLYTGKRISINSDGDNQVILAKSGTQKIKDIYKNELLQEALPATNYEVSLTATSEIASVTFDKTHYKYGDTINATVVTQKEIDLSNIQSGKELGMQVLVNSDENGETSENITLVLRLNTHGSIPVSGSDDGETSLSFRYTLTGANSQFDSDTLSKLGIKPGGNLQVCDQGGADSTCTTFQTTNKIDNSIAILNLSEFASTAGVNSVNSKFVALNTNSLLESGVGVSLQYKKSGETAVNILLSSTRLDTGDELRIILNPTLQDEEKGVLSTAKTNTIAVTSPGALNFALYNGISNTKVNRTAAYSGLNATSRQIIYKYTIQEGDLAHPLNVGLNPVDYIDSTGTAVTKGAALSPQFNTSGLFASTTNGTVDGLTDSEYQNPFWATVVDDSGDQLNNQLLYLTANEIQIDTRPRITSLSSDTTGDFREGDVIGFSVHFDKNISLSSSANTKAYINIGSSTTDITADIKTATSTTNTNRLQFEVTIPANTEGNVKLARISLLNSALAGYHNTAATNLAASLDVPANNELPNININNDKPKITGITLISPQGGYGLSGAAVVNTTLVLDLGIDKDLENVSSLSDGDITLPIILGTASGSTEEVQMTLVAADSGSRNLRFRITTTQMPTTISDYDGIQTGSNIQFGSGISVVDNVGNQLNTSLDLSSDSLPGLTVSQQAGTFVLDIDTVLPYITRVENLTTTRNCVLPSTIKCAKENEKVNLKVTFNEEVTFSNISENNFAVELVRTGGTLKAYPDDLTSSNRTDTSFDFSINAGTGYVDEDGITAQTLQITTGSRIADGTGNDITDYNLAKLQTPSLITDMNFDTIAPTVTTASAFTAGKYGLSDTVKLTLKFSEELTATSLTSAKIKVEFADKNGVKVTRDFMANDLSTDKTQIAFTYDVTNDDQLDYVSAKYLSPILLNGATIQDIYGNDAVTNFTEEAADTNVTVVLSNSANITEVRVKKGATVVPPDDVNAPTYFDVGDILALEVLYDTTVDILSYDAANKPAIDFVLSDSSSAIRTAELVAPYSNVTRLRFEYTVAAGDEDRNGIYIRSFSIKNVTDNLNKIVGTGTKLADIKISNTFANDIILQDGSAGKDNSLETVRVDTISPPDLVQATFTNLNNFDTATGTTTIQVTWPSTNREDIAKYKILLQNSTGITYTTSLVAPVSDSTGDTTTYVDTTDTTFDITINKAMVSNTNCTVIKAKIWAVDNGGHLSANGVETTNKMSASGIGNIYFNSTPPTLNTQSASGNTTELTFNSYGYPELTLPTATSNCTTTTPGVLFNIGYMDSSGDTQYLVPVDYDASYDITHYDDVGTEYTAQTALADTPTPFTTYTTTFKATDNAGLTASETYTWQAATDNLPIWYDAYDSANFDLSPILGTPFVSVTTWKNKGSGAAVQEDSGGTETETDISTDFNLTPKTTGTSENYTNVAPQYDSSTKSVYFPPSTASRANLYFDHDQQTANVDTPQNKRIRLPSNKNFTVYYVTTPSDYGVNKGAAISDGFHTSDLAKIQPSWFAGSGRYIPADGLNDISIGANFVGLTAVSNEPGNIKDLNQDARYDYSRNLSKVGAKEIIVYEFTWHTAKNAYAVCKYLGNQPISSTDCATEGKATIEIGQGSGIDKLYFGAAPSSSSGTAANATLHGSNSHNMRIHEFLLFADSHAASKRQAIVTSLAKKWQMPLVETAKFDMSIINYGGFKESQRPTGNTTQNGINLTCEGIAAANNDGINFFPIRVDNKELLANHYLHILVEQNRFGDKSGPITYMQLVNMNLPSTASSILTATNSNDGTGNFSYLLAGGATGGNIIESWKGLCHSDINDYTFAAYVSENQLTVPGSAQSIKEFEQANEGELLYKQAVTQIYNHRQVVYSLRRVGNYQGPAVRVRRPSDHNEMDIGFTAAGDFDQTTLTGFIGGSAGGFASKWYDQSGYGLDLIQVSQGRQPYIFLGNIIRERGKVALEFVDTSRTHFAVAAGDHLPTSVSAIYIFQVKRTLKQDPIVSFSLGGGITGFLTWFDTIHWDLGGTNSRLSIYNTTVDLNNTHQFTFTAASGNNRQAVYRDGVQLGKRTFSNFPITPGGIAIGGSSSLTANTKNLEKMRIQEFVIYSNDQWNNRATIETEQENYWGTP